MAIRISEIKNFSREIVNLIAPTIAIGKKQLGISTFGYRRFLIGGRSFGFSDNETWNQLCLENFTDINIPQYEIDLKRFLTFEEPYFMRKGVPPLHSRFLRALYETNIWNSLCLYQKNAKDLSIEAFFLAATRSDINITQIYMDKLDFIHNWVALIQSQLSACFTKKEDVYFSNTISDQVCLKNLQSFLLEKHEISINSLMSLSKREWEILFLLIKGYKRRQIALKLNIAPKTVDANIEHIKGKTNTLTKPQFLKCLQGAKIQEFLKLYEAQYLPY